MQIYFVRHGQTEFNLEGRIQGGHIDSPLTAIGIEGAKAAGRRLSDITFDRVYSSPLKRAKDTALIIMEENRGTEKTHLIEESDFRELGFGEWEGQLIQEMIGKEQFDYLKNQPEKYDPSQTGGETYQELVKRSNQALQKCLDRNSKAETILIVSHGITLTTLIKFLEGKPQASYRESGLLDNTSISIVETKDQGRHYQVLAYNS